MKRTKNRIIGDMTLAELVKEANGDPLFADIVAAIKKEFPQRHVSAARIIANGKQVNSKIQPASVFFRDGAKTTVEYAVTGVRNRAAEVLSRYILDRK
jgi:hypothetical protein